MIIAQIADLHVVSKDRLCYRQIPTNAQLAEAVAHINNLAPRPDLVIASGDLTGTVAADTVRFQSGYGTEGTRIGYQFTGKAESGKMSGTVALGEYGEARWTAERHHYRDNGRRG